jgi:DNA-3-methyladenine glycosylase II
MPRTPKSAVAADPHAAAVRNLSRKDPVLKALVKRVGPCTMALIPTDPFTVLVRCVIYQQISTKAAKSIFDRLAAACNGPPSVCPAALRSLSEEQFRGCGVSAPKQRALRAVLSHLDDVPELLHDIAARDEAAIRRDLTAIKGIGPWSVDMFLMFGVSRPDVLPVGDYGLKVGIKEEYGLDHLPTAAEMTTIAEAWRPYRSIGTWYIWRRAGPVLI